MVIQLGELEDKFVHRIRQVATGLGKVPSSKGKEAKTEHVCSSGSSGSEASITQDLSARTADLVITDKRKRGPDKAVGNSPPMESLAKRTFGRKQATFTGRLTHARAKIVKSPGSAKRKNAVCTPLSACKKKMTHLTTGIETPHVKGSLARYKYRKLMMHELKPLDASELQRMCREEGVPYDGKVDAIFNIADHRTYLKFDGGVAPEQHIETINIEGSEAAKPEKNDDEDDTAL
ncbi:hypothetical protein CBR_g55293 [Chara braunii]|uniref:Uncharacterized protein n=1 Tax=Chara braunii TaxID=69332 RepID=A0A388MCU5_CHABU|nr:hypothetical protein CBR_g55293 [Chara braunii]|eukprot:GBG92386.1 hypothetical protein CBR_g55293 [Chara braunii]